jgi:hypothetical protein
MIKIDASVYMWTLSEYRRHPFRFVVGVTAVVIEVVGSCELVEIDVVDVGEVAVVVAVMYSSRKNNCR